MPRERMPVPQAARNREQPMPYQMIYSSQATKPLTLEDLEEILEDARDGNERRNVTGVLVYVDGVFLQILEGERDQLVALMASIGRDPRHSSVKVFHEGEAAARMFGDWRMAYVDATPEQMAVWTGLPGTATMDTILTDIHGDPGRASQFAAGLLEALAR